MCVDIPGHPSDLRPFLTAKSPTPIPVGDVVRLDLLIQLALDPAVTAIEHVASVTLCGVAYPLDLLLATRGNARLILDIGPPLRDLDDEGTLLLAADELRAMIVPLSSDQVQALPRSSNARLIWAYRKRLVPADGRERIFAAIENDGDCTVASLGFGLRDWVFALACEGAVTIDIDRDPIVDARVCLGRFAPVPPLRSHAPR
ncbi:hypothetical protein ABIB73_000182 [Bradyrhizobium sp. F1.4.3]|uniref:hypothetical protein n=1 Tax=Bradyrhizobium sp. F1.4.3 TaxID=3156356 RepID=UPI00339143A3